MKCSKCGAELGEGNEYDLLRGHILDCPSKEAREFRNSVGDKP